MTDDRKQKIRELRAEADRVRERINDARDRLDETARRVAELERRKERRDRRRRQLAGDAPESGNGQAESDGEPTPSRVPVTVDEEGWLHR